MAHAACARATGFTLVELVVVILLLGILAAIAVPRLIGNDALTQRGFADEVMAALRYAQKYAIAKRREVCVEYLPPSGGEPHRLRLRLNPTTTTGGACSVDVNLPGGSGPYVVSAPRGMSLTFTSFSFNGLGQLVGWAGMWVMVSVWDTAATAPIAFILVSNQTGYAYRLF